MLHHLYDLKHDLEQYHIFFCYVGPISQNLLADIMRILEQKMSLEQASRATVLRVFSVIVEKLQNIIHYADEERTTPGPEQTMAEAILRQGILTVGYDQQHYFVVSGNVIDNAKVPNLRKKLTKIQAMNKGELKQYYQEQRRQEPAEGSKGAGLGFVEMARRASQPIEFDFRLIDEHTSFFSLKTVI
jgi:hypothetical protein